jgi:hypothetical protein
MTFAARALDLFLNRPEGVNRVDWLANQILDLAIESHFLAFRIVPQKDGDQLSFVCSDSLHNCSSPEPNPLRIFRTLLARFAKMAEEENGVEFNPYGGGLYFDRAGPNGPVRVSVEFVNTGIAQSLSLTLQPIETMFAEFLDQDVDENKKLSLRFCQGDRVRLKGTLGPLMLVQGLINNPTTYPKGTKIICVWFDIHAQPHKTTYPVEQLEHADVDVMKS